MLSVFFSESSLIWLCLWLLATPVIVLRMEPEAEFKKRILRLFWATLLGYVLLNLFYQAHHLKGWMAFHACQSAFLDGAIQKHPECPTPPSGLSLAFIAIAGGIFTAAYTALWELVWHLKYYATIRRMGESYKGKWWSILLIACSVPVWLWAIAILSYAAYYHL